MMLDISGKNLAHCANNERWGGQMKFRPEI
jgi:hypothetical protein